MRRLLLIIIVALVAVPARAKSKDSRTAVRDGMSAELERSMKKLKLPNFEAPYFIAYTVRDYDSVDVMAKFGAVFTNERSQSRQAYVEVRVGDYQFDNTADAQASDWNPAVDELYEPSNEMPIDDDADGLRSTLWLMTDARYK